MTIDLSRYTESERTRVKFLRTCAVRAPEILSTLESIMPLYMTWLGELERLPDLGKAKLVLLPDILSAHACNDDVGKQSHDFLSALCAWTKQWNFGDAWCFDEALQTLALWQPIRLKGSD